MTLRYWIVAAGCLTACGRPAPRDPASLLPARVAEKWQRQSLRSIPPAHSGIEHAWEANYDGAGNLTVDLYEARAPGTAFEMTQHWREAADSVFFDKGRYFVVVKWQRADRQALPAFIRELQKELGSANGRD
ncbi:MAG TPA: hypothetical protein VMI94_09040 [Bryobacteraceae bacterium]|nr:hypothetical protein [Bryobacteraceae bacterium]